MYTFVESSKAVAMGSSRHAFSLIRFQSSGHRGIHSPVHSSTHHVCVELPLRVGTFLGAGAT